MVVGEGFAGKTSLLDALQDRPFKNTLSTVGIESSTIVRTRVQRWVEMSESEWEKASVTTRRPTNLAHLYMFKLSKQAKAQLVGEMQTAEEELVESLTQAPRRPDAVRNAMRRARLAGLTMEFISMQKAVQYLKVGLCLALLSHALIPTSIRLLGILQQIQQRQLLCPIGSANVHPQNGRRYAQWSGMRPVLKQKKKLQRTSGSHLNRLRKRLLGLVRSTQPTSRPRAALSEGPPRSRRNLFCD